MVVKFIEAFLIILKKNNLQLRQEIELIEFYIVCIPIKIVDQLLSTEDVEQSLVTCLYDLIWINDKSDEYDNWDNSP